jgi:hypothetical protein
MEDEIGMACSTHLGRRGIDIEFWWEIEMERDH